MLLVKLLVGIYPLLVYNYQLLLPNTKHRRLLVDLAEVIAILAQRFRDAWQGGGLALVQLLPHVDELLLNDKREDIVSEGQVLVILTVGCHEKLGAVDAAELDPTAVGDSCALDDLYFVKLFEVVRFFGDEQTLVFEGNKFF